MYAVLPLLWLLVIGLSAPLAGQSLSGFTYNGQVYTSYQANEYSESPQGAQSTAAIRANGANYVSVMVTQYMQTSTSNVIAPETTSSPGYNSSQDSLSPTDSAVISALQDAHDQGLTVFLKPQVDSLDGVFRGNFQPTSPADWFASYQTFILHYAQIASENKVGGLIIGTELISLSGSAYKTYWDNIIAQIRSNYPDLTLAYGANATYVADEFTTVSFWDKVDIIGVDGYFPLTNHADPTVAELVAAWTDNKDGFNIVDALKRLQSTYNKPLVFTEIGYVSAPGTNQAPYSSAASGAAYDPTEQNNCYEAFFEVFSQQSAWMKGVFWWDWSVSPPGSMDTGYSPQNKPADSILVHWFGSAQPTFTIAPASSVLTLGQGVSGSDTISVTSLGGFTGSVMLAVTGLPAGVTASFAPGNVSGTQVLTLTANNSATPGLATLTITGSSGLLMASTPIALTVTGATAQTISFGAPAAQTVGTPLTLVATASSGLAVTFTSSTPTVCTVSGNVATFLSAGTCTIEADQSGNSSYAPATPISHSFTISASPSFTLTATPSALSLAQGSTAAVSISIAPSNGFTGSVTLATSGLPSGVTAVFSSNPVSGSSALTLSANGTALLGPASILITGTAGTATASTIVALSVTVAQGITLTPASAAISVSPGGMTTDNISISGIGGFVGSVSLTAVVTSSPTGAQDPPTLSFGAASPINVTNSASTQHSPLRLHHPPRLPSGISPAI